jgi:hypothetical protein
MCSLWFMEGHPTIIKKYIIACGQGVDAQLR